MRPLARNNIATQSGEQQSRGSLNVRLLQITSHVQASRKQYLYINEQKGLTSLFGTDRAATRPAFGLVNYFL